MALNQKVAMQKLEYQSAAELLDDTSFLFGNYTYGMNFFFAIDNNTLNLLDNPYFEVKGWLLDDAKTFLVRESEDAKLI